MPNLVPRCPECWQPTKECICPGIELTDAQIDRIVDRVLERLNQDLSRSMVQAVTEVYTAVDGTPREAKEQG